jgi:hypothetical protein
MRLRNTFGILIMLLLTQAAVIGQGTEPTSPWPPDPNEIFEDDVQWQQIGKYGSTEPYATVDNEQGKFQLWDGTGKLTHEFPFPQGVTNLHRVRLLPDGMIQIVVRHIEGAAYQGIDYSFVPGNVLLLDPETGQFSEAPAVCDDLAVQTTQGLPQWKAVAATAESSKWLLCETETGILLDILPDRFDWWTVLQPPDRNWLILAGYDEQSTANHQIFSYDLKTNTFRVLGQLGGGFDERIELCHMLSDTVGLLCRRAYQHYVTDVYYHFDLAHSFSVEAVLSGWDETMFSIDDPSRVGSVFSSQYFELMSGSAIPTPFCSLWSYDLEGLHHIELGAECLIGIHAGQFVNYVPFFRKDSQLYLLIKEHADATISSLKRYDIATGTLQPIMSSDGNTLSGEFESIIGVSPDDRYIVMMGDENGVLGYITMMDSIFPPGGEWQVVIFDQKTGELLYRSNPLGVYADRQVYWLDDKTVIIAAVPPRGALPTDNTTITKPTGSLQKLTFNSDGTVEAEILTGYDGGMMEYGSADYRCYLINPDDSVINLDTFESVRVMGGAALENYYLHMEWHPAGSLAVTIYPRRAGAERAAFLVTLPDCSPQ